MRDRERKRKRKRKKSDRESKHREEKEERKMRREERSFLHLPKAFASEMLMNVTTSSDILFQLNLPFSVYLCALNVL